MAPPTFMPTLPPADSLFRSISCAVEGWALEWVYWKWEERHLWHLPCFVRRVLADCVSDAFFLSLYEYEYVRPPHLSRVQFAFRSLCDSNDFVLGPSENRCARKMFPILCRAPRWFCRRSPTLPRDPLLPVKEAKKKARGHVAVK